MERRTEGEPLDLKSLDQTGQRTRSKKYEEILGECSV